MECYEQHEIDNKNHKKITQLKKLITRFEKLDRQQN